MDINRIVVEPEDDESAELEFQFGLQLMMLQIHILFVLIILLSSLSSSLFCHCNLQQVMTKETLCCRHQRNSKTRRPKLQEEMNELWVVIGMKREQRVAQ